tara:strand:+ start:1640 stop:3073 length:1434 start_codon:yes stop_codon:yes gene_type:complete
MAADINLIRSFKGAYSRPIADITPILEGVEKIRENIKKNEKLRRAEDERIKATVAQYKNLFPSDASMSDLPLEYKPIWQSFLKENKQQYFDDVQLLATLDPRSQEYDEAKERMDRIKDSYTTLRNEFTKFGEEKLIYMNDLDRGVYDNVNSPKDKNLNSLLYTDKLDLRIDQNGRLLFSGDGIDEFYYNKHKKLFNEEVGIAKYIPLKTSLFDPIYEVSLKRGKDAINKNDNDFNKNLIKKLVTKSSKEELVSGLISKIFADEAISPDLNYESQDIIDLYSEDEEKSSAARTRLEEILSTSLINMYDAQITAGDNERTRLLKEARLQKKREEAGKETLSAEDKRIQAIRSNIDRVFSVIPEDMEKSVYDDIIGEGAFGGATRTTINLRKLAKEYKKELNKEYANLGFTFRVTNDKEGIPALEILDEDNVALPQTYRIDGINLNETKRRLTNFFSNKGIRSTSDDVNPSFGLTISTSN